MNSSLSDKPTKGLSYILWYPLKLSITCDNSCNTTLVIRLGWLTGNSFFSTAISLPSTFSTLYVGFTVTRLSRKAICFEAKKVMPTGVLVFAAVADKGLSVTINFIIFWRIASGNFLRLASNSARSSVVIVGAVV